jgi:hypothetical protein
MTTRPLRAVVAAAALAGALWFLFGRGSADERQIRGTVAALAAEVNRGSADGLEAMARAARLASFFTSDVMIDLGQGSQPIHGRDTLMGMAARLQPRTAQFDLELDDVTVAVVEDGRATLNLTALIRQRAVPPGEPSLDAREFAAEMRRTDGSWQVSQVIAVDTLR